MSDNSVPQVRFLDQPTFTREITHTRSLSIYDCLIHAASELFSRQGFHRTSLEQISKASGVSCSSLYSYFEHKEDLGIGVLKSLNKRCQDYLMRSLQHEEELPPRRQCLKLFSILKGFFMKF